MFQDYLDRRHVQRELGLSSYEHMLSQQAAMNLLGARETYNQQFLNQREDFAQQQLGQREQSIDEHIDRRSKLQALRQQQKLDAQDAATSKALDRAEDRVKAELSQGNVPPARAQYLHSFLNRIEQQRAGIKGVPNEPPPLPDDVQADLNKNVGHYTAQGQFVLGGLPHGVSGTVFVRDKNGQWTPHKVEAEAMPEQIRAQKELEHEQHLHELELQKQHNDIEHSKRMSEMEAYNKAHDALLQKRFSLMAQTKPGPPGPDGKPTGNVPAFSPEEIEAQLKPYADFVEGLKPQWYGPQGQAPLPPAPAAPPPPVTPGMTAPMQPHPGTGTPLQPAAPPPMPAGNRPVVANPGAPPPDGMVFPQPPAPPQPTSQQQSHAAAEAQRAKNYLSGNEVAQQHSFNDPMDLPDHPTNLQDGMWYTKKGVKYQYKGGKFWTQDELNKVAAK